MTHTCVQIRLQDLPFFPHLTFVLLTLTVVLIQVLKFDRVHVYVGLGEELSLLLVVFLGAFKVNTFLIHMLFVLSVIELLVPCLFGSERFSFKISLNLFALTSLVSVTVFHVFDLSFQVDVLWLPFRQLLQQSVNLAFLCFRVFKLTVNLILKSAIDFHQIVIQSCKFVNPFNCFKLFGLLHRV